MRGLARLGDTLPVREIATADRNDNDRRRLLDPSAAWQVGNILIGTPPPDNGVHNRIAFKTGTSYGYRDAWSVGFDSRMTIGVWVGRPDGAPVPGLIGRAAAAPILFDAFARTGRLPAALPKPPKGTLIAINPKLPLPLRRFRPLGDLVRAGWRTGAENPVSSQRITDRCVRWRGGDVGIAGEGVGRRIADDHAGEWRSGRRYRQPTSADGATAGARICAPDGNGCDGCCGYRRGQAAIAPAARLSPASE